LGHDGLEPAVRRSRAGSGAQLRVARLELQGRQPFELCASQLSMSSSGARQVLVLKRIPMRNSKKGVEHRQDCE